MLLHTSLAATTLLDITAQLRTSAHNLNAHGFHPLAYLAPGVQQRAHNNTSSCNKQKKAFQDEHSACVQVLDLGHNALIGRLTITGLPSLRALMLNGNQLTGIEGTAHTLAQIVLQPAHSSRLHADDGMLFHSCILNATQLPPEPCIRPSPRNTVIAHKLQAAQMNMQHYTFDSLLANDT